MALLRVILDTTVLISGIAYPASLPGKIMAAWRYGSIDVSLSTYILAELRRVLPKLAHRHGLSHLEMDDLVDVLAIQAELVEPAAVTGVDLRDANDQPVLGTLLAVVYASRASYLITGDKDLLAVADHYPILTPAEFWAKHTGLQVHP
jgi:putative PIN family toxin of toxin-antitoxin system